MQKLPDNAITYIQSNFENCLIENFREKKDTEGNLLYLLDVNSNDIIYQLTFNEAGDMIHQEIKAANEDGYFENEFYGSDSN